MDKGKQHNTGGAYFWSSKASFSGSTSFEGNSAYYGRGIAIWDSSDVIISGTTAVTNNSASLDGGGIAIWDSSDIIISGTTAVTNNSAGLDGGGMYVADSRVSMEDQLSFVGNNASGNGGAIASRNPSSFAIDGGFFFSNTAKTGDGGAVSMKSAGDQTRNFSGCHFERNEADNGGAMYFFTSEGKDKIENSTFTSNSAVKSGGALFGTGDLHIVNATFNGNRAGKDGLAIYSFEPLIEPRSLVFSLNAFFCPNGKYSYDKAVDDEEDSETCRLELSCTQCWSECDVSAGNASVNPRDTIPSCEEVPTGVRHVSEGATSENFHLEKGYYRTSKSSTYVRECYREGSCKGGGNASNYCARGYEGPYCAVCAEGYSPGRGYTCHHCTEHRGRLSKGIMAVAICIVLFVVGIVFFGLAPVGGDGTGDVGGRDRTQAKWERRISSYRDLLVKAVPFTAVKTVVVVWQIITQFVGIAGDIYPEEYEAFLSKIALVDLDLGYLLSFSCIMEANFYNRLLLPLFIYVALRVSYGLAMKRAAGDEQAVRAVERKHISAAILVAFFVYSSVSSTIFQTFTCDELENGATYLRADYSLTCTSTRYIVYKTYAAFMVFVYPIGTPVIFASLLAINRKDLVKLNRDAISKLQPLAGLWATYKPSQYYFEVFECVRRIALTGVALFVTPGSAAQISTVLFIAGVFLFLSEAISPFEKNTDMALYRWGNGVIFASMFVALLLKVDVSDKTDASVSAFTGVLITANVVMILVVVVQSVLLVLYEMGFNARIVEMTGPIRRGSSTGVLEEVEEADDVGSENSFDRSQHSVGSGIPPE